MIHAGCKSKHCSAATGLEDLDNRYIVGLRAFLALRYAELYLLAFIQWFVTAIIDDASKMHENIGAWLLLDKAEAFFRIKPFYDAGSYCRHNASCVIKVWNWAVKADGAGKFRKYLSETRTSYYEEKDRKGKQMVNQIFKLTPILSIILSMSIYIFLFENSDQWT